MLERRTGPILAGVLAAGLFLAVGLLFAHMRRPGDPEGWPVPAGTAPAAAERTNPASVGVGWSQDPNPTLAARAALKQALGRDPRVAPHTLFVFATEAGSLGPAVAELRRQLGRAVPVFGGTSDRRGLFTQRGLMRQDRRGAPALAVMAIGCREIAVGVGSVDLGSFASLAEASGAAAGQALEHVPVPGRRPRAVLVISAGEETTWSELRKGIEVVVGRDTPILGAGVGAVVLADGVPGDGVSVAALDTDLPLGWTFGGPRRVLEKRGPARRIAWQTLLQGIADLPRRARRHAGLEKSPPLLGFGFLSSAAIGGIPAPERPEAAFLMSRNQGGTPFLAILSGGARGDLPVAGDGHGRLESSFLAIVPSSP